MKMLIQIASVFTFLYRGLLQAARVVASRAQVASWSARDRQKGASALEYLMVAAALIAILVALGSSETVKTAVETAFQSLFGDDRLPGGGEG